MTHDDLVYAAGFFDGEGCVSMQTRPPGPASFAYRAEVSQKAPAVLFWLKENFGGSVRQTSKGCHYWRAGGHNAAHFLASICPFLRLKRRQARLWLYARAISAAKPPDRVALVNYAYHKIKEYKVLGR